MALWWLQALFFEVPGPLVRVFPQMRAIWSLASLKKNELRKLRATVGSSSHNTTWEALALLVASRGYERSSPWCAPAGSAQTVMSRGAMRIDVTRARSFVRLALRVHKDCFLLHRCHDVALELAVIGYRSFRTPIAELKYRTDLPKKGFYTTAGDVIVALGFGQYLSIDHPEPNADADWHFDDKLSAASFLVDPYGDRYHIITGFRRQHGDVSFLDDDGNVL